MTSPSTTVILPPQESHNPSQETPPRPSPMAWLMHRNRLWLLLIIVMLAALLLGGCHARSDNCHAQASCSSGEADGFIAAFYVVYLLGWIIVSSCGG
ncbi:MAG TPA: hypothetical protein VHX44_18770 [Planctomycetota bacterium]|nr:hypothetical protein [Planctomycetota bacterium]